MSVYRTDPHPTHPVTTTTTNTTTNTTTTTTVNNDNASYSPPSLTTRPVGWHAKASGFDWNKRSDQHRYRLSIGLPEVHAAVLNHDWETAGELLTPDDIGMLWLPVISQRNSANNKGYTENGAWASTLPSKKQSIRLEAIRQMAVDIGLKTKPEGIGCVYGANLLTLCLQISVPPEFMEKMLGMLMKHAPQYLNLPDASGRTPLYIAVDQGSEEQVRMLLKAGAKPDARCRFAAVGLTVAILQADSDAPNQAPGLTNFLFKLDDDPISIINAYDHALAKGDQTIFSLLVENLLDASHCLKDYPIAEDPLQLEKWASLHSEDDVRALASRFNGLKSFLFNLKDKSGSSIVERSLTRKQPLDEDITPLFHKDPELGAIYAPAVSADIETFVTRLTTYLEPPSDHKKNVHAENLLKIFLSYCDPSQIPQLLRESEAIKSLLNKITVEFYYSLELPFEKFSALIQLMWPTLKPPEKELMLVQSARYDARYTGLIIGLSEFTPERNSYGPSYMVSYSSLLGNTIAFEFGMAHLDVFDQMAEEIKFQSEPKTALKIKARLTNMLQAGSLLWFQKYLDTGLKLQPLLDSHGGSILPLMADLSPGHLSTWLRGLTFTITEEMFNKVRTDEGRNALLELINPEKAVNENTEAEKTDS